MLGWIVALTGASLSIALAVAGVALSLRAASSDVFDKVAAALSAQDIPKARSLIASASEPQPLDTWLFSEREGISRSARSTTARDLLLLVEQARAAKLSSFTATFERIQRSFDTLADSSADLIPKVQQLDGVVEEMTDLWTNRDRQEFSLSENHKELVVAIGAFHEANKRFSRALGLPYEDAPPAGISRPRVYTSGVLSALPMLPRLPDGILDLPSLQAQLQSIGGQVAFSGPTAHEDFQGELESLQILTRKALDDYDQADTARISLDAARTSASDSLTGRIPKLASLAYDLTRSLVAANWPPKTGSAGN